MENLEDILKRLRDSRPSNGDVSRLENSPVPIERDEDECPICDGRRWLTLDVPVGHPDFGRAQPCECQAETTASERTARLRRYSNLGVLSRMTFDSADPTGKTESDEGRRMFAAAYEAAVEYAEEPEGWLILTGPNGSGKTHLAAAIANRCIEQGRPVFFVHVPDLLDDLRSTYSPHSLISYSELFDQVNDAPMLILDGLGTQSATPWAQEKMQQIFNRRANAQLPTIVTTSMSVADIDPYISSRMTNRDLSRIVEIPGQALEPSRDLGSIPEDMLLRMTFDTFDVRGNNASAAQRTSLENALESARGYASDPDGWGWLTLFGETGVGKTHLAVAIAAERKSRGQPVSFTFVPDLMDYLRSTFRPDSGVAYDRVFDQIRNSPLLILDHLSSDLLSDWAYEKLYQIVVHRHNSRIPTVITSPMDMADSSGPIISRTQDQSSGTIIRMDAPDYRVNRRDGSRRGAPERAARRGRQR